MMDTKILKMSSYEYIINDNYLKIRIFAREELK